VSNFGPKQSRYIAAAASAALEENKTCVFLKTTPAPHRPTRPPMADESAVEETGVRHLFRSPWLGERCGARGVKSCKQVWWPALVGLVDGAARCMLGEGGRRVVDIRTGLRTAARPRAKGKTCAYNYNGGL
jgi:hypothetical protein